MATTFSNLLGPLINVGGSILSGVLGSNAATGAAQTQATAGAQAMGTLTAAEQQALALQNQAYQQGLLYQTPYAQTGYGANRLLGELFGLTPQPTTTIPLPSGIGATGTTGTTSGINLSMSPGTAATPSTGQQVLNSVLGGAGIAGTGASMAGLLGLGSAAGPIGLAAAGLAEGIPALINAASGPNSYQAGSEEALRDFGVNLSDAQLAQLFGALGFSESQAWPIRKDLESSPQALIAMGQIAQAQGTLPQFLDKISQIGTSWGTFNFADAYNQGLQTGDWSGLNQAYNDAFSKSAALAQANPNWQQVLDVGTGSLPTGSTTGTGNQVSALANPYTGITTDLPQEMIGSLLNISGFTAPTQAQIQAQMDPSLQFQLEQGRKAIEASAAARGALMSGGTAKALEQYGQGVGSTYYQQAYQNALNNAQLEYNSKVQAQQNLYNNLMGLSGAGQTAANAMTGAGNQFGANTAQTVMGVGTGLSGLQTGIGAATAAGQVGSSNAWTNAINNIAKTVSGQLSLSNALNQNVPVPAVSAAGSSTPFNYVSPFSGGD